MSAPSTAVDGEPSASESGTPPGRVLVADDDEDSRAALRVLLEAYGYTVREAVDGASAVRVTRSFRPDLILMDIAMPGVDGLEATRRIRQDAELSGVTIVCVSGTQGAREAATAAGFDECLLKPVDFRRIRERVDRWLAAS